MVVRIKIIHLLQVRILWNLILTIRIILLIAKVIDQQHQISHLIVVKTSLNRSKI